MDARIYYLDRLIGMIFKILPMYESDETILKSQYINTLISDIISSNDILFNGNITEVIVKINSLTQECNNNHKNVKRIILDCTNIINKERELIVNAISGQ